MTRKRWRGRPLRDDRGVFSFCFFSFLLSSSTRARFFPQRHAGKAVVTPAGCLFASRAGRCVARLRRVSK